MPQKNRRLRGKRSKLDLFSLPTFIFLSTLVLITYGIWNSYQQDFYTLGSTNRQSYNREIPEKSTFMVDENTTITNLGVIDVMDEKNFIVSDGQNIMLVRIPDQINTQNFSNIIYSKPDRLSVTGKLKPTNQQVVNNYVSLNLNNNLLKNKKSI